MNKKIKFSQLLIDIKKLLEIVLPLMGVALSNSLMYFIDRTVLAYYSLDIMNAVAIVLLICCIFQLFGMGIVSLSEIAVAKYNGSKKLDKIGEIIWQFIWFSLLLSIIYIPVGLFTGTVLIPRNFHNAGLDYFRIIMCCNSLPLLIISLSAFYSGRKKIKIIVIISVIGNIINIILDYVMVFGFLNVVPAMGAFGAAIATIISQFLQVVVLFLGFFNRKNYIKFNISKYKFNTLIFKNWFKLGFLNSIGNIVELSIWFILVHFINSINHIYIMMHSIGCNIMLLFSFVTIAMQRGVTIMSANFLGEKKINKIPILLISANFLHCSIMIILLIPSLIFPYQLLKILLSENYFNVALNPVIFRDMLLWVWIVLLVIGIKYILKGFLYAIKDVRFTTFSNCFCTIIFTVFPLYILLYYYEDRVGFNIIWQVIFFSEIVNLIICSFRINTQYRNLKIQ